MDDQKNQQLATSNQPSGQVQQTPVVPSVQGSTGSLIKESEPMPSVSGVSEWVKPSEQPVNLEPEVVEAGVEATGTLPKLIAQQEETRVQPTQQMQTSAVIAATPTGNTQLTAAQATQIVKGPMLFKNASNPMLWLALLILRQLRIKQKEK